MNSTDSTIGVAGLGLLGRGIAACCLAHGFRVVGYTQPDQPHEKAITYIDHAISDLIDRVGFDPGLAKTWHSKFEPVETLDSFSSCDFVIESVVEDLASKRNVFDQIEEIVGLKVPVGSNTSSIPITQLQQDRKNPGRFVGMHWAEPAHATRFLELIRGERTSVETFEKEILYAKYSKNNVPKYLIIT